MRNKVVKLRYYVDGVFFRETKEELDDFYRSTPIEEKKFSEYNGIDGADDNVISVNLGVQKSKEVLIEIREQNDFPFFSKLVTLKANRFIAVEIN